MDFGTRLKQLRKEKNISQEDFAKKIGVSRSSIGNYETNQNMPTADILHRIADVLECSIDFLLGKSNIPNIDSTIEKNFYLTYAKEAEGLTPDEISAALRFYKEIKYGKST